MRRIALHITPFVAVACLLLGATVGCAGYATYPPVDGDTAINNPNFRPVRSVIAQALRWTIERHPVPGQYAVNLPEGLTAGNVRSIIRQLPEGGRPLTEQSKDLPVYHVSRIWIRGAGAEVDVHRPVLDVPGPDDQPVHQMMTVTLDGGFNRWRAESSQSWVIGAEPTPPLRFVQTDNQTDVDDAEDEQAEQSEEESSADQSPANENSSRN